MNFRASTFSIDEKCKYKFSTALGDRDDEFEIWKMKITSSIYGSSAGSETLRGKSSTVKNLKTIPQVGVKFKNRTPGGSEI